jgi:hypothetical protein
MKYIIDFVDSTNKDDINLYFNSIDCSIIKTYNSFSKVYLINADTEPPKTEIVESIINDDITELTPLGEMIPIDHYFYNIDPSLPSITIKTQDEKDWWKNYTLRNPDFDHETVNISRRGKNIDVYIMDGGIDNTHPEFTNTDLELLFSVTNTFNDTSGHGTAIASLISGETCGLSSANLKIIKIFDSNYPTKQSDLLNALDAILKRYNERKIGAAILNCSWSIPRNTYIEQKMRELIRQGFMIVAAAGNNGQPIENVTPAAMPEVLTVGSYNINLTPCNFSNYSNPSAISNTPNFVNEGQLDVWAPGEQIWVALPENRYGFAAGTSVSAAIQSCVLAYSLTFRLLSNGDLPIYMQEWDRKVLMNTGTGRFDILNLEDPKYSNSKNRISTIQNNVNLTSLLVVPYFQSTIRVGENKSLGSVFNPGSTQSFELVTPLPDSFYITPSGLIAGAPTSVNGNYEIYTSSAILTEMDNTIINVPITIAILSKYFDISSMPPDDPILEITKLGIACSTGGVSNSCSNDCGNYGEYDGNCNIGYVKPNVSCFCQAA